MADAPNGHNVSDRGDPKVDDSVPIADDVTLAESCSLPIALQNRNSLIYIINWSALYFIAPVVYVGILHADILKGYQFNDTSANLPSAMNAWVLPIPVIVSWLVTSSRLVRPLLMFSYLVISATGFIIAASFLMESGQIVLAAMVAHAAVIGAFNGVLSMCMWEVLRRGMNETIRGRTLSLAYGIGPLFAVLGSAMTDLVIKGNFLDLISIPSIEKPWNYVLVFGVSGPLMLLLVATSMFVTIPPRSENQERLTMSQNLTGLKDFLGNVWIWLALLGFLLTYAGCSYIMPNLGLYMTDVTGEPAENYTGAKMALRFGCKSIYGFLLGILMIRFNPRAPLLVTTGTCIVGMVWALTVPGKWYLLSIGFLGAGELFYLYFMNYIIACAQPENIRQYSAYTGLFPAVMGFVAVLYGYISDQHGYRASFWLALSFLLTSMVIIMLLPKFPPKTKPNRSQ